MAGKVLPKSRKFAGACYEKQEYETAMQTGKTHIGFPNDTQ